MSRRVRDRGSPAFCPGTEADEETGVDAAWAVEVEDRVREIESGQVKLIPWQRVRRRLDSAVSRGRKKR